MQEHLDLLLAMDCPVMVFAEVGGAIHNKREASLLRRPTLATAPWARLCRSLNDLGARLRDRGICLAYHHHMGTVVQTPGEVERLMQDTDETVGLVLDTGHLSWSGGDVATIARLYGQRLAHVHLKDVREATRERADQEELSFLDAVLEGIFAVPGDGDIEYSQLFSALAAADYDGWLVVEAEQDPARATPCRVAGEGLCEARRLAAQAGLR